MENLVSYAGNSLYSDVTFAWGNKATVPAHRIVVAMHSSVLKGAVDEAKSGYVLLEDDREAFTFVLHSMYGVDKLPPAKLFGAILKVANKYKVAAAQRLCESFLEQGLTEQNVFDLLESTIASGASVGQGKSAPATEEDPEASGDGKSESKGESKRSAASAGAGAAADGSNVVQAVFSFITPRADTLLASDGTFCLLNCACVDWLAQWWVSLFGRTCAAFLQLSDAAVRALLQQDELDIDEVSL